MATFRVEKTRDYTVMSNHHLKNRALTLKAKGLLSLMLSLPDEWNYTMKGLAAISVEGIDAIRQALAELEKCGYVVRARERDDKGCLKGTEYVIYEQPQMPAREQPTPGNPTSGRPMLDNPTLENPILDDPTLENPTLENPTQLNTKEAITYPIKEKAAANPYPYQSHQPSAPPTFPDGMRMRRDEMGCAPAAVCREDIHRQIEYDLLSQDSYVNKNRLDEIVDLMVETLSATNDNMLIAGIEIPAALVRERLRKINSQHIQYVFHCLDKNTTRVRNIKKYLLAVLYNAPVTMDGYYAALVNQEYGGIDLADYGL